MVLNNAPGSIKDLVKDRGLVIVSSSTSAPVLPRETLESSCCWLQKETIKFGDNTLAINFLNPEQYLIGTFSACFANQFILLCRMIPGNSIKDVHGNMKRIRNPPAHLQPGGY